MKREQAPVTFESAVVFKQLPKKFIGTTKEGNPTPSVKNVDYLKYIGGTPVVWTNFLFGGEPQELNIIGNSNVTIQNNSNIITKSGANLVLQNNRVYKFFFVNNIWIEIA